MAKKDLIFGSFRSIVLLLRRELPLNQDSTVRWRKLAKGDDPDETIGHCYYRRNRKGHYRFIIRISKVLTESTAILILLHEWAHALAWDFEFGDAQQHGAEWALMYAKCWRVLEKYLEEDAAKDESSDTTEAGT